MSEELEVKILKALEYYANKEEWIDFKAHGWDNKYRVQKVDSHFDHQPWMMAQELLNELWEHLEK